ncbi:MAG TPA: biotin--[acetyl-CoA-carboxylase] ligase [Anaerolineae bacterium]|nr:biotin--[acetyl-CoA-carboxylase] ligase [Anaerolineae bacterium]HCK66235.1 biotin--[acetyl-CoA-carboxylase] ligase [Anaerolineae bacterium]
MNETSLKKALSKINIGGLRYFDSIGSTNDEALAWAATGAKDFSVVIADEQTRGRGRLHRTWHTPKGSALAISLILRPKDSSHLSRTVCMSALAISDSLLGMGLSPKIKWPNDVLLNGKKVAGILVESVWSGSDVDSLVIGMGINVYKNSTPPNDSLQLPATSLEDELGKEPLLREEIVKDILLNITSWREKLSSDEMLKTWEERLAFRHQQVNILSGGEKSETGIVDGLESDGSLRLRDEHSNAVIVRFGDVSLRPAA